MQSLAGNTRLTVWKDDGGPSLRLVIALTVLYGLYGTAVGTVSAAVAGIQKRALNQAARELLLAQSSDWAFIIKADTMVEYAEKRTKTHLDRFLNLYHGLMNDDLDEDYLVSIETRDNIFPDIDYRVYH